MCFTRYRVDNLSDQLLLQIASLFTRGALLRTASEMNEAVPMLELAAIHRHIGCQPEDVLLRLELIDEDGNGLVCGMTVAGTHDRYLHGHCYVNPVDWTEYVEEINYGYIEFGNREAAVLGICRDEWSNLALLSVEAGDVVVQIAGWRISEDPNDDMVEKLFDTLCT